MQYIAGLPLTVRPPFCNMALPMCLAHPAAAGITQGSSVVPAYPHLCALQQHQEDLWQWAAPSFAAECTTEDIGASLQEWSPLPDVSLCGLQQLVCMTLLPSHILRATGLAKFGPPALQQASPTATWPCAQLCTGHPRPDAVLCPALQLASPMVTWLHEISSCQRASAQPSWPISACAVGSGPTATRQHMTKYSPPLRCICACPSVCSGLRRTCLLWAACSTPCSQASCRVGFALYACMGQVCKCWRG